MKRFLPSLLIALLAGTRTAPAQTPDRSALYRQLSELEGEKEDAYSRGDRDDVRKINRRIATIRDELRASRQPRRPGQAPATTPRRESRQRTATRGEGARDRNRRQDQGEDRRGERHVATQGEDARDRTAAQDSGNRDQNDDRPGPGERQARLPGTDGATRRTGPLRQDPTESRGVDSRTDASRSTGSRSVDWHTTRSPQPPMPSPEPEPPRSFPSGPYAASFPTVTVVTPDPLDDEVPETLPSASPSHGPRSPPPRVDGDRAGTRPRPSSPRLEPGRAENGPPTRVPRPPRFDDDREEERPTLLPDVGEPPDDEPRYAREPRRRERDGGRDRSDAGGPPRDETRRRDSFRREPRDTDREAAAALREARQLEEE